MSSSVGSRPARLVNGLLVSVLQVSGAGPLVSALGLLVNVLRRIAAGAGVVEDVVGLEGILVGVSAGKSIVELKYGALKSGAFSRCTFITTESSAQSTIE